MKRLLRDLLFTAACLGLLSGLQLPLQAQTEVLDDITTNTTWDLAGSPYVIMKASGRILIQNDATLTIEPGVRVEFPGSQSMITIKGNLVAEGTQANPIVFTRASGLTELWHCLEFNGIEGYGGGSLKYCNIDGGGSTLVAGENYHGAIDCIFAAKPVIENCTISGSRNGIYSTKESAPVIKNSVISNSEYYGLYLENCSPEITGNTFSNNASAAIYQRTDGDGACYPQYSGNTFGAGDFVLLNGTLQKSGTWEDPGVPYVINEEMRIQNGVTLTIEPGTEIQFKTAQDLLAVRGTLIAEGTAADPILFTRVPGFAGNWHCIEFNSAAVNSSSMKHAIVEYAGSDWGGETFVGAIQCVNNAAPAFDNVTVRNCEQGFYCHTNGNATIRNSTIQDNTRFGFYVVNSSPVIIQNTVTGNAAGGMYLHTLTAGKAYPSFEGNTWGPNDRIHLRGNADQNGTLEFANTPYVISQNMIIQDLVTLTVEPGVEFQFQNAADMITVYGTLIAEGTAAQKIRFTRAPELTGNWESIEFFDSRSSTSKIKHAIIEYGGGPLGDDSNLGALECNMGAAPNFSDCTIRNNQNGVLCYYNSQAVIENCSFENNNRFGVNAVNSSPTIRGCNFAGNLKGGVAAYTSGIGSAFPTYENNTWSATDRVIVIGNIQESGTWAYAATPYLIKGELRVERNATLTIEPGVELQFLNELSGLQLMHTRLLAKGTKDKPIKFTRAQEFTGSWKSLYIFGEPDEGPTELENCIFEYGGYTPLTNPQFGVITVDDSAAPIIKRTVITGSVNSGVFITNDAKPTFRHCIIEGNTQYGMFNAKRNLVTDAQECWWGDATGPLDQSNIDTLYNPDGKGQKVTNYIDYRNWLTVATGIETISTVPDEFKLYQNYPNPFNPSTTIIFKLERPGVVALDIADAQGRHIARIADGLYRAGTQMVSWDAVDDAGVPVASGTYYYTLHNAGASVTRSMILTR